MLKSGNHLEFLCNLSGKMILSIVIWMKINLKLAKFCPLNFFSLLLTVKIQIEIGFQMLDILSAGKWVCIVTTLFMKWAC